MSSFTFIMRGRNVVRFTLNLETDVIFTIFKLEI